VAQSPAVATGARLSYEEALATLRALWEDALERPVTDDDDFFELGGDSILALSVAGRAAQTGLSLPRTAVLRRPTLRLLAEAVVDPRLFALD
jgi:aryl carrier-like protein